MERQGVLPEELLHDPQFMDEFLVVREDRLGDGSRIAVVVAHGRIADEAYVALRTDRRVNPHNKYYFAKPVGAELDVREHWSVGGA